MSASYTVTLNDNVVSKLQAIVGSGGIETMDVPQVLSLLGESKLLDKNNLVQLLQSKVGNDIPSGYKIISLSMTNVYAAPETDEDNNMTTNYFMDFHIRSEDRYSYNIETDWVVAQSGSISQPGGYSGDVNIIDYLDALPDNFFDSTVLFHYNEVDECSGANWFGCFMLYMIVHFVSDDGNDVQFKLYSISAEEFATIFKSTN